MATLGIFMFAEPHKGTISAHVATPDIIISFCSYTRKFMGNVDGAQHLDHFEKYCSRGLEKDYIICGVQIHQWTISACVATSEIICGYTGYIYVCRDQPHQGTISAPVATPDIIYIFLWLHYDL